MVRLLLASLLVTQAVSAGAASCIPTSEALIAAGVNVPSSPIPGGWFQGDISTNRPLQAFLAKKCITPDMVYSKTTNPISYAVVSCNSNGDAEIQRAVCSTSSPSTCSLGTSLTVDLVEPPPTPTCKHPTAILPAVKNGVPGGVSNPSTIFDNCNARKVFADSSYAKDQVVGIYPQVVSGMKYTVALCAGTTPLTLDIYCPITGDCTLTPKVCKRPKAPAPGMTGAPTPIPVSSVPENVKAAISSIVKSSKSYATSTIFAATVQSTYPPKYVLYYCNPNAAANTPSTFSFTTTGTKSGSGTVPPSSVTVVAMNEDGSEAAITWDDDNSLQIGLGVGGGVIGLLAVVVVAVVIRRKGLARRETNFDNVAAGATPSSA